MDLSLNILKLASQLASHASARQKVITQNVAHADTPGYKAQDLASFDATLARLDTPFTSRTTRPGHIAFGANPNGFEAREATVLGAESPNGNTVSLEDQMMRAADTRQTHDLALGVYGKTLDILRTGIGRGR
jgi:flagellar basal-body rod protein FlgB